MKIGLHITTFNRLLFTQQCLKSIEWSKPSNSIIVIVDNNSNDDTSEFLKSYSSPLLKHIIFNDKNEGLGYAVNQGWNILKGECDVLGWINNDFLFEPGWESNVLSCFQDLDLDYIIGTVRPDLESERVVTSSGKGFHITTNSVGAAYFLLSKHFKNGISPSSRPFETGYVGPGPRFHHILRANKLKGVRIAHPGVLVRDSEYTKPEYKKYYDETFGIRSKSKKLAGFRAKEAKGKPRGWTNWKNFTEKYYPSGVL